RLDPNYALARAGLALASSEMHLRFAPPEDIKMWGERAHDEAYRALKLDPDLAEAHLALASVYGKTDFKWEQTIEESHRTLDLNPSLDLPHYYLARSFYHLGLLDAGKRELQKGFEVNPDESHIERIRTEGIISLLEGRYTDAVRLLEKVQSLS